MLTHSTLRRPRTALAGAATVLAAAATAAPASAALDYFHGEPASTATSFGWGMRASVPDSADRPAVADDALPAVQDTALNFTAGD